MKFCRYNIQAGNEKYSRQALMNKAGVADSLHKGLFDQNWFHWFCVKKHSNVSVL